MNCPNGHAMWARADPIDADLAVDIEALGIDPDTVDVIIWRCEPCDYLLATLEADGVETIVFEGHPTLARGCLRARRVFRLPSQRDG